jgi:hypothetical protein
LSDIDDFLAENISGRDGVDSILERFGVNRQLTPNGQTGLKIRGGVAAAAHPPAFVAD